MNYSDFQNKNSSEKVVLCKVKASQRLIGFDLYFGSVYQLTDYDYPVVEKVLDSDVELTEVFSIGDIVPGSYFNDTSNKLLYLETIDSVNPNGKFITHRFWNFYSNVGVNVSNDLGSGFDVHWLPLVKSTSDFGNELDNEEQLGFAIEGSGQISLGLDRSYWDDKFELYIWDNQPIEIYSWNRDLPVTEAKIIYKGKVVGKTYSTTGITFKLKDQLLALRQPYPVSDISEITSALVPEGLTAAKQRRIYGRIAGFLPTNIDQVVDTYTLTGTLSFTLGSSVVTGSGTSFLNDVSPDDEIVVNILGEDDNFTIKSVTSDTSLELTENFSYNLTGIEFRIKPNLPKKYINRNWLVAGHECNQPTRTITSVFNLSRFTLDSVADLTVGDDVFVGDPGNGENAIIEAIEGNDVRLTTNLVGIANIGTAFVRPCVQNLRWNSRKLIYDRDYTIDFTGSRTTIVLNQEFEKNLRSIRALNGTVTFTSTSRSVTGTDTQFTKQLEPGGWIRGLGEFDFFEILSIESDVALTLRTPATYTQTDEAQYLGGRNFDTESDMLSCEVTGTTDDSLYSGVLLNTASEITQHMLESVGITDLNQDSFDKSRDVAPYMLGLVIPAAYDETTVKNIRDLINQINLSVFGSLVQNEDIELEYNILRPNKPPQALVLREHDILSFSIDSNNERVAKTAIVNYKYREFDYQTTLSNVPSVQQKYSDTGQYLVESTQDKIIDTLLFYQDDARILANRWAFLLELGTNVIKIETKMQAMRLQVNDVIKIEHEKLFERLGGGKIKYAAIQSIKKNGLKVSLELDDLSNCFNRVAVIASSGWPDWNDSTQAQKAAVGYITDSYGLINNDRNTIGLNVIW